MKHTMLKCLSLVMALATLVSVCALPAIVQAVTPCNHYVHTTLGIDSPHYIGTKAPTCTEWGGRIYNCPECHKDFVDTTGWEGDGEFKILGHDWLEVERQNPTLTEAGWVKYECQREGCGAKKTETLKATKCENGCTYEERSNTATCTENGIKTLVCVGPNGNDGCGFVEEVPVLKLGHDWDKGEITEYPECGIPTANPAVEPKDGKITFTCEVCDVTKVETVEAPAEHKLEWHDAVAPKCGVPGNTAGYTCANPNCPWVDGYAVDDIGNHHWIDMEHSENKAVTCLPGFQWQECDNPNCDAEQKLTLDPITDPNGWHNPNGIYSKLGAAKPSTCYEDGYFVCTLCEAKVTNVNDPKGHKNETIAEQQAATCEQFGYILWYCDACGSSRRESYLDENGEVLNPEMNKQPHTRPTDETLITVVERTCIEDAYEVWTCTVCTRVQQVYLEGEQYKATGHNMVKEDDQAATCVVNGYKGGQTCSNAWCDCECNDTAPSYACQNGHTIGREVINAPGHNFQPTRVPADCSEPEHDGQLCTVCGVEDERPEKKSNFTGEKDLNTHNYIGASWSVENEATCVTPGTAKANCNHCNAEGEIEFDELGHDWTAEKIGSVPATCGGKGYDVYACKRCNTFKQENIHDLDPKYVVNYDSHYKYVAFDNLTATYPFTWVWTNVDNKDLGGTFTLVALGHDADGKTPVMNYGTAVLADGVTPDPTKFCIVHVYEKYTCTIDGCGQAYTKLYSDSYGPTGGHVWETINVPGDCYGPGILGKVVCERCAAVDNEGTVDPIKHEVPVADMHDEIPAQCTVPGTTAGGICSICGTDTRKPIPALDHKVDGVYSFELVDAKLASCLNAGWNAHFGCTMCDAVVLNNSAAIVDGELDVEALTAADIKATIADAGATNGYEAQWVHNFVLSTTVPYGCEQDGYVFVECNKPGCDAIGTIDYNYGFANHRYTNETNRNPDTECKDSYLLCAHQVQINAAGRVATSGTIACDDKLVLAVAKPHTNDVGEGEVIRGIDDCMLWDATQDHVCKYCDVNFTLEYVHVLHPESYKTNVQEANCQIMAHNVNVCYKCPETHTWIDRRDPVTGADYPATKGEHPWREVNFVAPSYTAGGYTEYECSLCEATKQTTTKALEGVKFDLTVANKNAGYEIFDGSIIAVKVTTSAYNVGATSIKVTMAYNADVFTFVGFTADNGFSKTPVSFDLLSGNTYVPNATNAAYANNGVVTMVSVAEKTAGGQLQEVNLMGTETYMTLYFRVATDATTATAPFGFNIVESTATEENTQVLGLTTDPNGAVVKTSEKVVIGTALELASTVKLIGDINGDTIIGMEDIEAMRKIILKAEGYTAPVDGAADIDKDGDVDLDDYALLQKVMLGMADYQVLAAALDVDADGDCDADDCTLFIEYVVAYKALNLVF